MSISSFPHNDLSTLWTSRLAQGAEALVSSAIRELLKVTQHSEAISFAGGLPAPECFPVAELARAAEQVMRSQAIRVLQYSPTEGLSELREFIASLMLKRGLPAQPQDILITSGSQQALDLLGKLLLDPGDPVLVEAPTYLGALQAWRPYRPRFVSLPLDDQGLKLESLERALNELQRAGTRPKFLYLVSSFQNPTGVTLSAERRTRLIDLAGTFGLPIIEDDPYGELRYEGTAQPPLATLDAARWGELRHVIYLSTFSKLLAPGLRVGWINAPAPLRPRLVQAKQGTDLHAGSLAQAIAYEACRDGLLDRHIPVIRATYAQRRDAMLQALARYLPADISWTRPEGGMFLWLTLPQNARASELLHHAVAQYVAFVPGSSFYADGGGENTLRLSFSHATPERIEEGIQRLVSAMRSYAMYAA